MSKIIRHSDIDFRKRNLYGQSFRFNVFENCLFDRTSDFTNADFRYAIFVRSNIHDATLSGAIGNGSEIVSLQISTRPITMTKTTIWIDCVELEPKRYSKGELMAIAYRQQKETRSLPVLEWADIIYDIWEQKFLKGLK